MLVLVLALTKVALHAATALALDYSYFVDELYYLAAAEHLDWGYVDLPPLMPALTALQVALFGNGLLASRVLVTLAGGGLVLLGGLLARELGGGGVAQGIAALSILTAPIYLAGSSFNSMNGYEPLLWAGCAWVLARLASGGAPRHWLLFGGLAGAALLTKHTSLLFGFATVAGLASTRARRAFREPWFWAAGGVAFLLFLPNLVWLVIHRFPHLEVLRNIARNQRDVSLGPFVFLAEQIAMVGPAGAFVVAGGLAWLLLDRSAARFRHLGCAAAVALFLLVVVHARVYYTNPLWAPLFAAGGVALERRLGLSVRRPRALAVLGLLLVVGALTAPLAFPCLPPATYVAYSHRLGVSPPRLENPGLGPLPQLLADRFGWRETAEAVAAVYHRLPEDERRRCAIFAQDYGRAGAIDRFGPDLGLPKAISGHLTYYDWGPRGYTGEAMIVLGDRPERLEELFSQVEFQGFVYQRWALPRSTVPVWLCRRPRVALATLWPKLRKFE